MVDARTVADIECLVNQYLAATGAAAGMRSRPVPAVPAQDTFVVSQALSLGARPVRKFQPVRDATREQPASRDRVIGIPYADR